MSQNSSVLWNFSTQMRAKICVLGDSLQKIHILKKIAYALYWGKLPAKMCVLGEMLIFFYMLWTALKFNNNNNNNNN